jgi:hypothetical protein
MPPVSRFGGLSCCAGHELDDEHRSTAGSQLAEEGAGINTLWRVSFA